MTVFCGILRIDWDRTALFRCSGQAAPASRFQTCQFPCIVPLDRHVFCWAESKGAEA